MSKLKQFALATLERWIGFDKVRALYVKDMWAKESMIKELGESLSNTQACHVERIKEVKQLQTRIRDLINDINYKNELAEFSSMRCNHLAEANTKLMAEMAANRITKQDLDEQAAMQLEMDGHRVELERDLVSASHLLRHSEAKVDRLEGIVKSQRDEISKLNEGLQKVTHDFKVATQYKPLYMAGLERIKAQNKQIERQGSEISNLLHAETRGVELADKEVRRLVEALDYASWEHGFRQKPGGDGDTEHVLSLQKKRREAKGSLLLYLMDVRKISSNVVRTA